MSGRRDVTPAGAGSSASVAGMAADPGGAGGVFVGVRRFQGGDLKEISCAVDDAVDLAHLFVVELERIAPQRACLSLAGEPSKQRSVRRLEELTALGVERVESTRNRVFEQIERYGSSTAEGELFVLSFATHGFQQGEEQYLAASDSSRSLLSITALGLDQLSRVVGRARASLRLLLIDSCREHYAESRGMTSARSASDGFQRALARFGDEVVLCAAPEGGFAFEDRERRNGVFTAAVLDGLAGEAPVDEEGYVTLDTLSDYVNQRVVRWVRENQPHACADSYPGILVEMPRSAGALRLASPDEVRRRRLEARRRAALELLRRHLQEPLAGRHYDAAQALLAGAADDAVEETLLEHLEHLDGSERSRSAVAYYLERYRGGEDPRQGAAEAGADTVSPSGHASPEASESTLRQALDLWYGLSGTVDHPRVRTLLLRAVEEGDVAASVWLAWLRTVGAVGFRRDPAAADAVGAEEISQLEAEAAEGRTEAGVVRSLAAYDGVGAESDPQAAVRWARWAAERGDSVGMNILGCAYSDGSGVERNSVEAVRWLREAARLGNLTAECNLGVNDRRGEGVPRDPASAVERFRHAAEANHVRAMRLLAGCLSDGEGVERDEEAAFGWYRRAANLGDAKAMGELGVRLAGGRGAPRDLRKAVEWCRHGAELGDPFSAAYLAALHADGTGVEQSYEEARRWFERAVELGYASAHQTVGEFFENGHGVERDPGTAAEWYRRGAEAGHAGCCGSLARLHLLGEGVEEDEAEALRWAKRGAEAGDPVAMRLYAVCLREGYGVDPDLDRAVGWYREAADRGDTMSLRVLAELHSAGEGVEESEEGAAGWYRRAAEAGDPVAMGELGLRYEKGRGLDADPEEAVAWYRRGAAADDAASMRLLAWCFDKGLGVEADPAAALAWNRRAAELGDVLAMNNLGVLHEHGKGVEADATEAVAWYRKAAAAGSPWGMFNLGRHHLEGDGVERDAVAARHWLTRARDAGHPAAGALLERLAEPDETFWQRAREMWSELYRRNVQEVH